MDAFATWKIMPEFKVRASGQFFTPLGYENYDISPATLETVDFSRHCLPHSLPRNPYEYNLVDYGRDLGIMFMGDIFDSGKGFSYLHYERGHHQRLHSQQGRQQQVEETSMSV
ncbi:MAG: hypothetical protein ACLSHL_09235 [Alistipes communis]